MAESKPITVDTILGLPDVDRMMQRVVRHAMGEEEMTPTELAACKLAIGKLMPDAKAVEKHEHSGSVDLKVTAITLEAVDAPAR